MATGLFYGVLLHLRGYEHPEVVIREYGFLHAKSLLTWLKDVGKTVTSDALLHRSTVVDFRLRHVRKC